MRIVTLLILLCVLITRGYTQPVETPYKIYDFSSLDVSMMEIDSIGRQLDSIYRTSGYDSLLQLMTYIKSSKYTEKYVAFSIGYQMTQGSLGELRSGLQSLGFSELSEDFGGVPWGVEVRGKRLSFQYLLIPGIKNRASNNDYTVEVNGISLQFAFGYDILRARRVHLYPQIAFGLQDFEIDVMRKNATTDVATVNDLVLNPAGTQARKSMLDMSYGVELDYHLLYSNSGGGIILGFRYGRVETLADGKFEINNSKSAFKTSDSISESFFSVVAKFYIKR